MRRPVECDIDVGASTVDHLVTAVVALVALALGLAPILWPDEAVQLAVWLGAVLGAGG